MPIRACGIRRKWATPLRAAAWLALAACIFPGTSASQTCEVPAQFLTIKAAVNDPACAIIEVAAGVYTEMLAISRSLTLHGAGPANTVLAGPLLVSGADTVLKLMSFGIDTTGPFAGCYPFALAVINGAAVYPQDMTASHGAGVPIGPCPLFDDGFESGG